jgi:lysozyme
MDINKLREELEFDEGCVYEIYKDHLGYPTFGIGHLVLESDPEHGESVGTPVCKDRVIACFENDVLTVFEDLDRNLPWWREQSDNLQRVLANMSFNLGITRLLNFKKFLGALELKHYKTAAEEMMDSRWATQVGPRATRLRDRVLEG